MRNFREIIKKVEILLVFIRSFSWVLLFFFLYVLGKFVWGGSRGGNCWRWEFVFLLVGDDYGRIKMI